MKKLVYILLIALLLVSCSVTSNMVFTDDNLDGSMDIDVRTSELFKGIIEDLSSWQDDSLDILELGMKDFADNLEEKENTGLVSFEYSLGNCKLNFDFTDFQNLVTSLAGKKYNKLLSIKNNGKTTSIEVKIDIDTYSQLEDAVPFLKEENVAVYGPRYNQELSEQDYYDMMQFIFSEEIPEKIQNSEIKIDMEFPRPVISTNGKLNTETGLEFTIPLIDFLLLHDPIVLEATF